MASNLKGLVGFERLVARRRIKESSHLSDVRVGRRLFNRRSNTVGTLAERIDPKARFVSITFKQKTGKKEGKYRKAKWRTTNVSIAI